MDQKILSFLAIIYIDGCRSIQYTSDTEQEYYRKLVEGGLLGGNEVQNGSGGQFSFASPVAKRVFYENLFPGRADPEVKWDKVDKLVIAAVKTLSWKMLQDSKNSSSAAINFPKEAAFQHLLMAGLAQNMNAFAAVAPEVSQSWGKLKTLLRNK